MLAVTAHISSEFPSGRYGPLKLTSKAVLVLKTLSLVPLLLVSKFLSRNLIPRVGNALQASLPFTFQIVLTEIKNV